MDIRIKIRRTRNQIYALVRAMLPNRVFWRRYSLQRDATDEEIVKRVRESLAKAGLRPHHLSYQLVLPTRDNNGKWAEVYDDGKLPRDVTVDCGLGVADGDADM